MTGKIDWKEYLDKNDWREWLGRIAGKMTGKNNREKSLGKMIWNNWGDWLRLMSGKSDWEND